MLTLHLQADTLTELRAQAILALDIRTLSHEQAAAKVTELQYEVTVSDDVQFTKEESEKQIIAEAIDEVVMEEAWRAEPEVMAAADRALKEAAGRVGPKMDQIADEVLSKETAEPVVSDAAKPESVPEKPAKKTRAKKEKPAIIAAFAEAIEKQADEPIELLAPEPERLTVQSVHSAFQQYVQKFGFDITKIDGPILVERIYGQRLRIKDIPEHDQEKLGRIIAAVEGAILTNEFKRPTVTELEAAKAAAAGTVQ